MDWQAVRFATIKSVLHVITWLLVGMLLGACS